MILIIYTTLYRKGGEKFARAAQTLAKEKRSEFPDSKILCRAVESKQEVVSLIEEIAGRDGTIDEFHFIGHSGVYGPMFGTTNWPEQFSPHEWRTLAIPFADGALATFHACRTARWFTRFFARTFDVRTRGYYWYTCFSRAPDRFVWERRDGSEDDPLWVVSIGGRKSHGLVGSLGKYTRMRPLEALIEATPEAIGDDAGYDRVAELYDQAFADIRVREDEWSWLNEHLPGSDDLAILDIGCGNGSLLAALSKRIGSGVGLDASTGMIEQARERFGGEPKLRFEKIDGPTIPLPDNSIDIALSFMSFRYLDWDPLLAEIERVVRPEGRLLVIDMAAAPVGLGDLPDLISSKLRHRRQMKKHPQFRRDLTRLVSHPDWKRMVALNPVRAEHEYRWYLASRFPSGTMTTLNTSTTHRLLAFDSGEMRGMVQREMSYP